MIWFFQATKAYQADDPILAGVDCHIKQGEFVCLTGRSGAGKSTFLKLLYAGILPSEGEVVINGHDISKLKRRELPMFRRKIGIVFQDFKLLPRRTVYENVALTLEVQGFPDDEVRQRVEMTLEEVGLAQQLDKYPSTLSGGEQQRVAIARALVHQPWLLIADEPTGNLDAEIGLEILDLFSRAHSRGTTVIVATHDMTLLSEHKSRSHRLLHIENGKVVDLGEEVN